MAVQLGMGTLSFGWDWNRTGGSYHPSTSQTIITLPAPATDPVVGAFLFYRGSSTRAAGVKRFVVGFAVHFFKSFVLVGVIAGSALGFISYPSTFLAMVAPLHFGSTPQSSWPQASL